MCCIPILYRYIKSPAPLTTGNLHGGVRHRWFSQCSCMCGLGEGVRSPVDAENNRRKKLAGFHGAERYIAALKIEQHEQGLRPGGKKVSGHCGNSKVEGCPKKLEKEPTMPAADTAGTGKFSRHRITTCPLSTLTRIAVVWGCWRGVAGCCVLCFLF